MSSLPMPLQSRKWKWGCILPNKFCSCSFSDKDGAPKIRGNDTWDLKDSQGLWRWGSDPGIRCFGTQRSISFGSYYNWGCSRSIRLLGTIVVAHRIEKPEIV